MRMSQQVLLTVLQNSVVELKFRRRHDKPGWNADRRMLCTNNIQLLNSVPGKMALHFRPPTHPPAYPWRAKNLACAWDLFWQDYRMISCEAVDVITVIPAAPAEDFWNYFNVYLQSMSAGDKVAFMNK